MTTCAARWPRRRRRRGVGRLPAGARAQVPGRGRRLLCRDRAGCAEHAARARRRPGAARGRGRQRGRQPRRRDRAAARATAAAPRSRHQLLVYPVTRRATSTRRPMRENAEGYFLTARDDALVLGPLPRRPGAGARPATPRRCAPRTSRGPAAGHRDHRRVRPAARRGRGLRRALRAAGVPVLLKRYDGMIHGFFSMADMLDDGRAAQRLIAEQLRAAFS